MDGLACAAHTRATPRTASPTAIETLTGRRGDAIADPVRGAARPPRQQHRRRQQQRCCEHDCIAQLDHEAPASGLEHSRAWLYNHVRPRAGARNRMPDEPSQPPSPSVDGPWLGRPAGGALFAFFLVTRPSAHRCRAAGPAKPRHLHGVKARLRHASTMTTLDCYLQLWPDSDDSTRAAVTRSWRPALAILRTFCGLGTRGEA